MFQGCYKSGLVTGKGAGPWYLRWLKAKLLESGLGPLGQTAEKRMAGFHSVEVGEQHVLCVLRAAVELTDHDPKSDP